MRKSQWLVIVALIVYTVSFSGCDQGKTMMDQILPEPQPTEMMEPEPQLVVIDDPVLVQTFTDDRPGANPNINGATYSPDGKYIAGSGYQIVWLWDSNTGELINTLEGHTNHVWVTTFTSDSQILASACDDHTVGLWNVSTGENLHFLTGHTDDIRSVSISPDDTTVASASLDGSVKLWSVSTGELLASIDDAHSAGIRSIDFSHDGQMLATGSEDNTIRLWTSTGQLLNTLESHTDTVETVVWSPSLDRQLLASGSADSTVRIWNPVTGELLHTLTEHTGEVYSVVWSPDSQLLASGGGVPYGGSMDPSVRLWNPSTGEFIITLIAGLADVEGLDFSPDGKMLVFGSDDGTLRLYDLNRSAVVVKHNRQLQHLLTLSPILGKMYWVDLTNGWIQRVNLDGTNIETITIGFVYFAAILITSKKM